MFLPNQDDTFSALLRKPPDFLFFMICWTTFSDTQPLPASVPDGGTDNHVGSVCFFSKAPIIISFSRLSNSVRSAPGSFLIFQYVSFNTSTSICSSLSCVRSTSGSSDFKGGSSCDNGCLGMLDSFAIRPVIPYLRYFLCQAYMLVRL